MSEVGILDKLEQISIRYEEIAKQMVDPEVINDMKRYVKLNREYKDLSEIVTTYKTYKEIMFKNMQYILEENFYILSNTKHVS